MYAKRRQSAGIVIFSDGNPIEAKNDTGNQRDGFRETRRQLAAIAANFRGKVLLVHNQTPRAGKQRAPVIRWKSNLGELAVASDWVEVTVAPLQPTLLSVGAIGAADRTRD